MGFYLRLGGSNSDAIRDLRKQMIRETNAFLNWALSEQGHAPRIPRRRVDRGGFAILLRRPDGRALAHKWWSKAFSLKLGGP